MNNKFIYFCMILITAIGLVFSGCNNDPYKDMKLIVDKSSIQIMLDTVTNNAGGEKGDEQTEANDEDTTADEQPKDETGSEKNIGVLTAKIEK